MLKKIKSKINRYRVVLALTSFLAIMGLYPGMGGEGEQRDVALWENKIDQSGFILAVLYDNWPNFFNSWLYSLSLLQIFMYLIGTKFIYGYLSSPKMRKLYILISIIGVFFMFQVVRDATALSLYVLGFGLLLKSKSIVSSKKFVIFPSGICIIILGTLFKPVLSPIVALIFYVFCTKENVAFYSKLVRVSATLILAFSPFMIDKILTSELKMTQIYAEQQLFIYDITKMYCWGHSQESVAIAKETITPFLAPESNYESLCASLEPMGWDDLRRSIPEVNKSPAIRLYKGDDTLILRDLMSSWIKIIRTSPFEWLQIKVIDASQVLFMANSIYIDPVVSNTNDNQFFRIGDLAIKLLFAPIHVLDKLRVFSLGFALLVGFVLIFINGRFKTYNKRFDNIALRFILINLNTWFFLTLLFIANPGRYTLPFVILSYTYLLVALNPTFSKSVSR